MAFLQAEQLETLAIDKMVFHVVGPEDGELILLEEIEPGPFSDFFLDRLKSTNNGIMLDFHSWFKRLDVFPPDRE